MAKKKKKVVRIYQLYYYEEDTFLNLIIIITTSLFLFGSYKVTTIYFLNIYNIDIYNNTEKKKFFFLIKTNLYVYINIYIYILECIIINKAILYHPFNLCNLYCCCKNNKIIIESNA